MPESFSGKTARILDLTTQDLIQHHLFAAAYIGAITIEWSRLEVLLAHFYALLMFGARKNPDIGESVAIDAFETAVAIGTKRNLLLRATEIRTDKALKVKFSRVLRRSLQDAYDARNEVVHARWCLNADNPKELVRRSTVELETPLVYEHDDFTRILGKIRAAEGKISKFFVEEIVPRIEVTDLGEYLSKMLFASPPPSQNAESDP